MLQKIIKIRFIIVFVILNNGIISNVYSEDLENKSVNKFIVVVDAGSINKTYRYSYHLNITTRRNNYSFKYILSNASAAFKKGFYIRLNSEFINDANVILNNSFLSISNKNDNVFVDLGYFNNKLGNYEFDCALSLPIYRTISWMPEDVSKNRQIPLKIVINESNAYLGIKRILEKKENTKLKAGIKLDISTLEFLYGYCEDKILDYIVISGPSSTLLFAEDGLIFNLEVEHIINKKTILILSLEGNNNISINISSRFYF